MIFLICWYILASGTIRYMDGISLFYSLSDFNWNDEVVISISIFNFFLFLQVMFLLLLVHWSRKLKVCLICIIPYNKFGIHFVSMINLITGTNHISNNNQFTEIGINFFYFQMNIFSNEYLLKVKLTMRILEWYTRLIINSHIVIVMITATWIE